MVTCTFWYLLDRGNFPIATPVFFNVMKLPFLALSLLSLVAARLIDPKVEVICPDRNPSNCYPKVFVPTDEWQPIRENQEIPPGLHVRMNIDTGSREARILQSGGAEEHVPAVVGSEPEVESAGDMEQEIQDTIHKYKQEQAQFRKSSVSETDLSDFSSSVEEVLHFGQGGDISRMEKALDTLSELSHDLDFGERLTTDPRIFSSLLNAAELVAGEPSIAEKCFRIMGSSLRNNPVAIENVLEKQDDRFVGWLFAVLEQLSTPDVVQKRILGVVHALTSNTAYAYQKFNAHDHTKAEGFERLVRIFPGVGASSRERIALILEDLNLLPLEKREEESVPEVRVSAMLQEMVTKSKTEKQLRALFESLVQLHLQHQVKPSDEFLLWLSKESEARKHNKVRDVETVLDTLLLDARHAVFGNPNAVRKADEF